MLRRPPTDVVLELVDLVVEPVDHGEEALGDLVDQEIEAHARRCVVPVRGRDEVAQVARVLAGRGLAHCHDSVKRRDDIDLVPGHVAVAIDRRQHEDPEHVVAVRFEPGPGLVVVPGRRPQTLGDGRVQRGGDRRVDRGGVGIREVDPPIGVGHGVTIWVSGRRVGDHELDPTREHRTK